MGNPLLDLIMKKYNVIAPLVVKKLRTKNGTRSIQSDSGTYTISFVLGIYDTTSDMNVTELEFVFGSMWSSRVRIVLWIFSTAERTVDEILKDFWNHNVLNVDIIVRNTSNGSWEVFTYNPFVGVNGSMEELESEELFPDKLADFHNHSIPISVFDQFPTTIMTRDYKHLKTGPDSELLFVISRKMNFSIDLKTAETESNSYETTLKNNETTGVVGDIINGRSEVVWNRQYVENSPKNFVAFTYPYHTTKTCIMVRKANQIPAMVRVVLPFPLAIWYAIFSVLGVLALFMRLAKERNIFHRVIRLLLFQNIGTIPKKNVNRVYSISWIFWSVLMAVVYQANLVKDLMMPKYYRDIDTLDELYDTGSTLHVGYNIFPLVNNSESDNIRRFVDRTKVELNFDHCINRVINREPVACTVQELLADYLPTKREYRGQTGPKLYKMKEHLTNNWEAFFVKRGSPYLEKFNDIIQRLVEGGFYNFWMKITLDLYIAHEQDSGPVVLKLRHFKGGFCILILGLVISTLTFIREVSGRRFCNDTGSSSRVARLFSIKQRTR